MKSPRVACMTMVKNDVEFLDIWARYYVGQFGAEHCYVIDHGSDDMRALDRARAMGVQVLRLPHTYPSYASEGTLKNGATVQFDRYRFAFLSKQRVALREFYDVVIMHDVDEVLVADPAIHASFADFMAQSAAKLRVHGILGGIGVEIFHDPASEGAYDPAKPVLSQRSMAHFRLSQCKPVIFHSDAPGRAHSTSFPFALDPDLWLLHLKFLDRDLTVARQHLRHAAVQRGEVGDWTRWAWAADEVNERVRHYLSQPIDPDDQRGVTFLSDHMRRHDDGCLLVESRAETPAQLYQAQAGSAAKAQKELQNFRFCVPERFRKVV